MRQEKKLPWNAAIFTQNYPFQESKKKPQHTHENLHDFGAWNWANYMTFRGNINISHPESYKYFSNVSRDIFNSSSRPEISVTWNVFLLYLL